VSDSPADELWSDYRRTRSTDSRAALVAHYTSLVRYVASQVSTGMPQWIEQNDLVGYGVFGLIDAIEKFDPNRNTKFETYAITRIRGAIMDELRSIDWVPRSLRGRIRELKVVMRNLEDGLQRSPTPYELAAELDIPVDELEGLYTQIAVSSLVPLEDPLSSHHDESMTFGDTVADRAGGPDTDVDIQAMSRMLAAAITGLGDRERMVLQHYYYQGHTLAEIGALLGVTESRVCQIHTRAVTQLKSFISLNVR
jgi:RNA polymerase sigma factor for flagellar operon FliA